jgi:oligoribonuclease NrnB/cAMP/cGMP phosphodiesterase (DHH superfamily)
MWKFELPHTREIMAAVFSYEKSFEDYDKLMKLSKTGIKDLIKEGIVLERKYRLDLAGLIKQCQRVIEFEGYTVPIANLNGLYASDAGNIMSENNPFSITYYDTAKSRVFSLRSKPTGVDVSIIASKFKGGGHKHAAGFKVSRDHELARI